MNPSRFTALPLVLASVLVIPEGLLSAAPGLAQTVTTLAANNPGSDTLYLNPDTVFAYNLAVANPTTINGVSLPSGAVVRGQFEPVSGGLRYVATGAEVGDRIYSFQAASDTLHDIKDPRETTVGSIAGDTAIGAAGGAVVGSILGGHLNWGEVLGGAAAGAIIGNVSAQRVVVVEPDQTIQLQTQ